LATAFYTVGSGQRMLLGSLDIPADYFTGRTIGGDSMSFAGIYASHRNGTEFTTNFDSFSVQYVNVVSGLKAVLLPEPSLSLFPVPAKDVLNIEFYFPQIESGEIELSIFDNIGRQIMNRKMDELDFDGVVDVSELSEGVYVLKLVKSEHVLVSRFMVRR
ncbi:MAG: T9SS type A sorting domain-containing protein, partial [Maribacter sp.]|uniref:T9SS type A sorting domain-containing protein n=1 Tax=Maribacter sp. TaxID=1897614 RepID=UPI00329750F0